ncbi:MAG: tripartite tricarboxylate transporter substrate binding protein [Burkholderiaceae bacterium]|nr:tripartite tricarboxylate transporter substrate binding protein [Burkholderiaceae bacterium]
MNTSSSRRRWLGATALLLTLAATARADERPIEWVVGMAAGGGSDVVARTVAEAMAKQLGQTIVVTNKPGAATNIAADYVAKTRAADVDRVLLTGDFATLASNPFLYGKLSYNADRDLASVGMLVRFPLIVVVANNHPAKSFKELVAWIKAQPQAVNYASPGAGTPHHLATELLLRQLGLKAGHVPYRGAAPALQDVAGGQLPFMLVESAGGMPLITGGRLRALAVGTAQRMKTLPEVPTLQEQGVKGFEAFAWQGLSVPASASAAHVARLNQALRAAQDSTYVKARFQALGVELVSGTPQQMQQFAQAERQRWGGLIKDLNLKLD